MPTSVHIPPALLAAVDRRAKQLGVSRNRVVVAALEREVTREDEWPPGFFEHFSHPTPEKTAAVDEILAGILAGRRSRKKPPRL